MYQQEELRQEEFKEYLSADIRPRYVDLNMLRVLNRKLSKKQKKNFKN